MVVQHNIASMNANRYYNINNSGLAKSLEKLSSGYAINRAGDNAAGLAVSEKMRSQIGGLTQGVKNAQDGISMIQTYEGALTETDAILQRMKTLADQSANGTYQDDVDREAIQLEFNQLNDELDQIADTDFNGVVMLNGGQMADGLKAVDGKFDYANKAGQLSDENAKLLAEAQKDAQAAIDAAQVAYGKAYTKFTTTNFDLSSSGLAAEWNTVDNNTYNQAAASALWTGLQVGDAADETLAKSGATKIEATFTLQDDGTWEMTAATSNALDKTGDYSDAKLLTALKGDATITEKAATATTSGAGGFTWESAEGGFTVNALADTSNAKAGDTITLVVTNEAAATKAPTNVGFKADSVETTVKTTGGSIADASVAIGDIKDADMTENLKAIFDALDGMEFTATYAKGDTSTKATTVTFNDQNMPTTATDITLTDSNGKPLTDSEGNSLKVAAKYDSATGKLYIAKAGTADGDIATTGRLATITFGAADDNDTEGTVTGKLAVESYDYSIGSDAYSITAGDDSNLGTSTEARAALDAAKKVLDDAKAAYPKTIDDITSKVSKSDSYDQSTTTLTYTDQLTLQAGARTKDSVQFTFKYDSNGLGDLKANMNCSSRTDGLGTADLSLLTQKDANFAIDKIDNAINKVSMIRATFGATQNRLEHKIDNMNVTKENITSAESRIRDTDVSEEMANFTKNQILSQASQSMLAQANSLPQNVLQLLG